MDSLLKPYHTLATILADVSAAAGESSTAGLAPDAASFVEATAGAAGAAAAAGTGAGA